MKIFFAFFALLATPVAQADEADFPLFCNVTEYLGSSFQEGAGESDGWRGDYTKTQTRVFWEVDLKKGVNVDSALLQGLKVELGVGEAVTWNSAGEEKALFILEGRIEDTVNESVASSETSFTKTAKDETPGLSAFLRLSRKNRDVVEVSCAKRIK